MGQGVVRWGGTGQGGERRGRARRVEAKRGGVRRGEEGGAAMMHAFPADFELWKNGVFADDVGTVNGGQPEYMMNGQDAKSLMEG